MRPCFKCGSTSTIQKHHIIPRAMGGMYRAYNQVKLCNLCHYSIHESPNEMIQFAFLIQRALQIGDLHPAYSNSSIWLINNLDYVISKVVFPRTA